MEFAHSKFIIIIIIIIIIITDPFSAALNDY